MNLRRPMLAVTAMVAIFAFAPVDAAAQSAPPAPAATARLQGRFRLSGQVTVAQHIRGEHAGETVTRMWQFRPLCASGQCDTVILRRHRHAGTDRVTLRRRSPGHYSGKGHFAAPLACDGHTYPRGERIPFTITVQIDAAILQNRAAVASQITATYTNRARINRTPCVAFLGHDAAGYAGNLIST